MVNQENQEPILLDEEGYQKFLDEIEALKAKLKEIDMKRGQACSDAVGDSWHDNFAHDEAMREERFTMNDLRIKQEQLKRVKIVKKTADSSDKNLIEIGDIIKLDMIAQTGKVKEHIVKLVASFGVSTDSVVREVTLDSPLGSSIYHKHVGDQASYSVNEKSFTINIKAKVSDDEKTSESEHPKTK